MRATVDLIGMYNYDNTLLDLMQIPEDIDRATLIANLLLESAEQEILYSNLGFLKQAIGSWSAKQLPIWQHLLETTKYDYNPIWNKDGTVTETETRDLKGSEKVKDETDRVDNLTDKNTRDFEDKETRDLKGDNLNSVYGFNSSDAAPANKDESSDSGTDTIEHSGTDTIDHTGRQDIDRNLQRDTTDTGTVKHERIEQGNIGLTSTQDLISQERQIALFNVMDVIIKDFIKRFCLAVY
jgi:hypothetical protein